MTDARQQRGLEIAALCRIQRVKRGEYHVPSQTGKNRYTVRIDDDLRGCGCTCPDHELRGVKCKHMYAVEYWRTREVHDDGSHTLTETVTVTKRTTYPQNWPAYNEAQTNEKREFQRLLHDLCRTVPPPPQQLGRPRLAMADAVFSVTFKVYSTVSGRRFTSDLCDAQAKGFLDRVPHYNSLFDYMENPELTPILRDLITVASLPLRTVESDFAVDSTGFCTSRFVKWFDHKYGVVRQEHGWVKTHLMCGVKTNVVTAVEILDRNAADAPQLPGLVDATARNFTLAEVSADKGYLSVDNMSVIARHNATPFIAFKNNSTAGAAGSLWEKMFHYFSFERDTFLDHYHKRSNVESTVMMIKAKFGDGVRSKTDVAMKNEVLCKVLAHNICCLISAIYELGINPVFGNDPSADTCPQSLPSARKTLPC